MSHIIASPNYSPQPLELSFLRLPLPFAVGPIDVDGSPGDHRAHLRHWSSALEVPRLEVGEHAQPGEDVQRSMHRVQVIAEPIQRSFLKSRVRTHKIKNKK